MEALLQKIFNVKDLDQVLNHNIYERQTRIQHVDIFSLYLDQGNKNSRVRFFTDFKSLVGLFDDERTLLEVKHHICHCYRLKNVTKFLCIPLQSKISDVMDDFSL